MLEETIRITLTAAIELVDAASGRRYRNKAVRVRLPMGLKWQWKEDGYLILTGSCTEKEIDMKIEGADIISVHCRLHPDQDNVVSIPVYPSPGRKRLPGILYREGRAAAGSTIWAELQELHAAVRLRSPYPAEMQNERISLFSRQKLVWLGQTFLIAEGEQREMFTVLGAVEGEDNVFRLAHPLSGNYSMKAAISPLVKTITDASGRYLLAYPKEAAEIGQIHEEQ